MDNITLFIATSGRRFALDAVLKAIELLDYPKDRIRVVFSDSSASDEFFVLLKDWLGKQDYASGLIVRYMQKTILKNAELTDNFTKMRNITRMYEETKKYIETDLVFYVEDDIEIPPDTLTKLLPLMDDPEVVMATGRVMTRFAPTGKDNWSQVLTWDEEKRTWVCTPKKDEGVEQVSGSTWGCTLGKVDIIKQTSLYNYDEPDWGQDAIFARAMRDKKKIMVDWSIHTRHCNWDGKVFE